MRANDSVGQATHERNRKQLQIYAAEPKEHIGNGRRLGQELAERNRQLEQSRRELAALNRLFQEHLRQRLAAAEAYHAVLEGVQRLNQQAAALAGLAQALPGADPQRPPPPDRGGGGAELHPPG